jgi:hypothetical protein
MDKLGYSPESDATLTQRGRPGWTCPSDRGRLTFVPEPAREIYAFRFTRAYALAALPFGVTRMSAWLAVTPDELRVRFGPWRLVTPLANIAETEVSGPYRFVRTAGPAHLSFSDHGVTFATNGDRGTCITFHEPVRALNPLGPPLHPNLTVTVREPQRLAERLRRR